MNHDGFFLSYCLQVFFSITKMSLSSVIPFIKFANIPGGNFKGGCPPLMGIRRGHSPLGAHANGGFSDLAHAL